MIVDAGYTWSSDLHVLLTPGIGFLVVFRCTSAFNRFWEARGHISKAIKGCRTLAVIVITQYHRHANKSGDVIPKQEMDLLLRRRTGQAITALKWIGARLAYLES